MDYILKKLLNSCTINLAPKIISHVVPFLLERVHLLIGVELYSNSVFHTFCTFKVINHFICTASQHYSYSNIDAQHKNYNVIFK